MTGSNDWILKAAWWLAVLVAVVSCSEPPASSNPTKQIELEGRLTITGSSTIAPLIWEIAKRFEQRYSKVRVDVQTGGSSRGIADVRRGTADVGMASRKLSDLERQDLAPYLIAQDGICMVIHTDNPVRQLTDPQIRDIYTGKINHWREVGGLGGAITVVNKAAGRATFDVFINHYKIDPKTIQADIIIGENEQCIQMVAGNPNAIGYVSVGTGEYVAQHGSPIKLLPVDGVAATTANVASGRFAMGRPLNLVTLGGAQGLAHVFIDYCQSEAVHDIVRALCFIPVQQKGG